MFGLKSIDDLDAIKPTLEAGEVVVPERKTFYGSREILVRAPCGTIVNFAEFEEWAGSGPAHCLLLTAHFLQ